MRFTNRQVIGGGFAGLAAMGFVGVLFASVDRPAQQQRLSNGQTVSLVGIAYPERPKIVAGAPLLRLLAPVVPATEHERFGIKELDQSPSTLMLWLKVIKPPEAPLFFAEPGLHIDSSYAKEITDELGNQAFSQYNFIDLGFGSGRRNWQPYQSVSLSYFPRRGGTLRIGLTPIYSDSPADNLVFEIWNPYQRDYPTWKGDTLPATRKLGGLEVDPAD